MVRSLEAHALHRRQQFVAVDAAVAVDVDDLKSSPCRTLTPAVASAAFEPARSVDFVGEVEGENLHGGSGGRLGGVSKRVAVAGVKRVIPRVQAEVLLVRCHEVLVAGEVARVAANDAVAERFELLVGMQAGARFGLHLRRRGVRLRHGRHAKGGPHEQFLLW